MASDAGGSDPSERGDRDRAHSPVPDPPDVSSDGAAGILFDRAGISEQGPARKTHEDTLAYRIPGDPDTLLQRGAVFLIADGVGGHGGGDIASREAAKTVIDSYYASKSHPERALKSAVGEANLHVYDLGLKMRHPQLSTTLSAVAIVGARYHIVHIGDSRVYRLRPHTDIEQLTEDHSETGELVRMQILKPENVRHHPRRHVITRSLGSETVARPMAKSGTVQAGDIFVLCTDGLWDLIPDDEISEIARFCPPGEACQTLIDLCMTRDPTDNITVQIVHVVRLDESAATGAVTGGLRQALMRLFGSE